MEGMLETVGLGVGLGVGDGVGRLVVGILVGFGVVGWANYTG